MIIVPPCNSVIAMEPGPIGDSELEEVIQTFVGALREGDNDTAMEFLDRELAWHGSQGPVKRTSG